jgi:hypothetical protein
VVSPLDSVISLGLSITAGSNLGKQVPDKNKASLLYLYSNLTVINYAYANGAHPRRFSIRRADVVFAIYIAVVHT